MNHSSRTVALVGPLVATAMVFFVAAPATADLVLGPATFHEYVTVFGNHVSGPEDSLAESVSVNPLFPRGTGSSAAWTHSVHPVSAWAETTLAGKDSPAAFGGGATAEIRFDFAVVPEGDGDAATVPVRVSGSGYVEVDAGGSPSDQTASAVIDFTPGPRWTAGNTDPWGWYNGRFEFDELWEADLPVNTAYEVRMSVNLHGQGQGLAFHYDATGYVDPVFEIDPSFPDADEYTFIFSDGVTPEPASLGLLALASPALLSRKRR